MAAVPTRIDKSIPKYRPVLSGDDILHIIRLCKRDGSSESLRIAANLAKFEWTIRNGSITPAYTSEIKPTLIEDLGFDEPKPASTNAHVDSASVSLEALYTIWLREPESLTLVDIARIRAWRYQNNKMTIDEEKAFEKEVLGLTL